MHIARVAAILAIVVDCYGSGRGKRDASGMLRYDHTCCGVFIFVSANIKVADENAYDCFV